jgi:hypothetical protein
MIEVKTLHEDLATAGVDAAEQNAAHTRAARAVGENFERRDADQLSVGPQSETHRGGQTHTQTGKEARSAVDHHTIDVLRHKLRLTEKSPEARRQGFGVMPLVRDHEGSLDAVRRS